MTADQIVVIVWGDWITLVAAIIVAAVLVAAGWNAGVESVIRAARTGRPVRHAGILYRVHAKRQDAWRERL